MAQIIERIVRSKYPPRDTRVLWLDTKNDLLKACTPNGWTKVFANTAINTLRNAGYLPAVPVRQPGKAGRAGNRAAFAAARFSQARHLCQRTRGNRGAAH